MRRPRNRANKYPAKTVIKALQVLDFLGTSERGGTMSEIARALQIGKSTVHRLLATLCDHGYVWLDPFSTNYILGAKMLQFGENINHQSTLIRYGTVILDELARKSEETCNMGVLEGNQVLYLIKKEPSHPLRMSGHVGKKFPAHCTALGKVLLSGLSEDALEEAFGHDEILPTATPNSASTLSALKTQLAKVRETGLALDNEELFPDVLCLGAPVFDYSGRTIAAISIAFPKFRMDPEKVDNFKSLLLSTSAEFSRQLGFSRLKTDKVSA